MAMSSNFEFSPSYRKLFFLALMVVGAHYLSFRIPVDWKIIKHAADDKPIEIEKFVELAADDTRQVVDTSEAAAPEVESTEEARFLGETKHRVKKESRSSRVGRFQERRLLSGEMPTIGGDLPVAPWALGQWGIPAQSPNVLPDDIERSSETLLNTDPVVYAAYYNRIGQELYDVWIHMLRDAISHLALKGIQLSEKTYFTEIGLIINRQGGVAGIQIVKSSGVSEFDEAARDAFWKTEPFLNPPVQLFKSDSETAVLGFGFYNNLEVPTVTVLPQFL